MIGISNNTIESSKVHLIPEFCAILPIPHDLLYTIGIIDKVMLPLEREVTMRMCCGKFLQSMVPTEQFDTAIGAIPTFTRLLSEAFTIFPKPTYQRLEFLGDAILSYYVCNNIVAYNGALQWDANDIGDIIQKAVKNRAFVPASIRLGITRFLLQPNKMRWKSSYDQNNDCQSQGYGTIIVNDSILSDLFESVISSVYLANTTICSEHVMVEILNMAKLPFPKVSSNKYGNTDDSSSNKSLFSNLNSCRKDGYPFHMCKDWTISLSDLMIIFEKNEMLAKRLQSGMQKLEQVINYSHHQVNVPVKVNNTNNIRILLYCALFDDPIILNNYYDECDCKKSCKSGDNTYYNYIDNNKLSTKASTRITTTKTTAMIPHDYIPIVRVRDMLYHIGAWSLKLCLCKEAYDRYPYAEENDLHLLESVALVDDGIAYIMMKTELHKSFVTTDQHEQERSHVDFEQEMVIADKIGREIWDTKNGWIIGLDEYQNRAAALVGSTCTSTYPQYPGLCGGRLRRHYDKLPKSMTKHLVASFKALFGAYVLSIGLEKTWNNIFCQYFDEFVITS
jgi:dsRNA-specific ribonuclease